MTGPQPFSGTVWRAMVAGADPLAPVRSPEGRFHHGGQWAIYSSLTAQGCAVAIARYLRADDPPRVVVPLSVTLQVINHTGQPALSVVWQDLRASGGLPPTWAHSDNARAAGAQGLLYSSRSRPDLTHLVLFDAAAIRAAGAPRPFPA
ncbi:MAG: RES family NAD+ phosphorylase [Paracoccaceae bacterium]